MRGGSRQITVTARWHLMRTLAEQDSPLWLAELAQIAGVCKSTAQNALHRPRVVGWVDTIKDPDDGPTPRLLYSITDAGRARLAALADTDTDTESDN